MPTENILTESFLSEYKDKQPDWGFNGLGYIVYKRSYARKKENGLTEEWWETVARCVQGAQDIGAQYTKKEAERLYEYVFNLKCNFAGRMLWQLGTNTVQKFGANSLLNCFAGETLVLTRQGWKSISSLAGQEVELITKNGKWVKAPIKQFGKQKLLKLTVGIKTATEVIYVTPNHDWIVDTNQGRVKKQTKDLKPGNRFP